jgi:putative phosphoesterase
VAAARLAVLSDTHLPRGSRRLSEAAQELLRGAELILHAGDISTAGVLAELEALGPPVLAVHGNVDSAELRARLPEQLVAEAGGRRIGMVHDAGPAKGRLERLRRRFAGLAVDAVVFGHSHIPLYERAPDGFAIFNPGSPTDRRRQPHHTMGVAHVGRDAVTFELLRV